MLLYADIYLLFLSPVRLRYLSENKIEALPDKIFKGVENLKAMWVQLITNKKNIIVGYLKRWKEYNRSI